MAKREEFHASRFGAFTKLVQDLIKKNPRLIDDYETLRASIIASLPPDMRDKSMCGNCGASMKEYIYIFDCWDALLLIKMAEEVKRRLHKGMTFTIANQVRIPELDASHAIKCRTTQTAKLGLIAQLRSKNSGGRVGGVWVVTRRGWDALEGKPVPAKVKVWRKKIEERFDETTTIAEALKSHVDYVTERLRRGRKIKQDMRVDAQRFNPEDWFEMSVHTGTLI